MKEATFNSEIVASLRAHGAWAYKVPDSPTSWTMGITRYTPEKPCDIIAMYRGKGFLIESKQAKKFEAFGLSQMRPNQIKNLDEAIQKGNRGFVFLNIRIRAVKGESSHENRLVIFDWAVWKPKWEQASTKHKEVRALPFIEGQGVGPKEKRKMLFDLSDFLTHEIAGMEWVPS